MDVVQKRNPFHLADELPLSSELPELVSEKDPDTLALKIEHLLEKHIKIDGFSVTIMTGETAARYPVQNGLDDNIIHELDDMFIKTGDDPSSSQKTGTPFIIDNGKVFTVEDEISLPESAKGSFGIAFYLNSNGLKGGMYLLADRKIIDNFLSDDMQTENVVSLFSGLFENSFTHQHNAEKMRFFRLYETVSSALGYVGDLKELLTTIISIVISELPSEEGSVLLLDETTNELEFFSAIGEIGFGLTELRFPADRGIAGHALQHRKAIIVNNVQTCPYFFNKIDNENDFVTKSILAVPLVSGEECIGVIEAINKVGSDSFDDHDKRMLMAIADEVALAVKNARLFDYVVDSYCKIRQGKMSCKGCVRPLKTWTPCARQLNKV